MHRRSFPELGVLQGSKAILKKQQHENAARRPELGEAPAGDPRRQDERCLQRFEEHAEGRPGVDILPALAECRTEPNTAELNVKVRERWQKVIATSVILNPRAGSNNRANFRCTSRTTDGLSPRLLGEPAVTDVEAW
jgi:hypothetical protein